MRIMRYSANSLLIYLAAQLLFIDVGGRNIHEEVAYYRVVIFLKCILAINKCDYPAHLSNQVSLPQKTTTSTITTQSCPQRNSNRKQPRMVNSCHQDHIGWRSVIQNYMDSIATVTFKEGSYNQKIMLLPRFDMIPPLIPERTGADSLHKTNKIGQPAMDNTIRYLYKHGYQGRKL